MKIISWNVNGIRAVHKKGLFFPFIEKYQPDIICLQETKAFQSQHEVNLPGYQEYWNSAKRPGYSGTAIFTKIAPLLVLYDIPEKIAAKYQLAGDVYGQANAEGRVIVAEFPDCYVACVYTPNAKDDLSRLALRKDCWDPAFLEYMKVLNKKKPVIFCGDLNVAHEPNDLARPKQNVVKKGFTVQERQGIENMLDAGFVDSFRMFTGGPGHYTWWSHFAKSRERNIGWRIDYIFISSLLKSKVARALIYPDVLGSDHCPVALDINL
jgi:exodeoxyribonuclease-3